MNQFKSLIDYKNLEEELCNGLQADHLYKLQNSAKIRAIEQNVPTYEHFRQMVNGAHLRPLERRDFINKHRVSWNPTTELKDSPVLSAGSEKSKHVQNDLSTSTMIVGSKRYKYFLQTWDNAVDLKKKFQSLWEARHDLKEIFHVEIPSSYITQFLSVCLENLYVTEDVSPVIDILTALSHCSRFDLGVSFLGDEERSVCSQLFKQLHLKGKRQNEIFGSTIRSLAVKYHAVVD